MTSAIQQKKQFWILLIIVFLGFLGISIPYLIFPALFLNPAYSILPVHWSDSSRALALGITLAAYPLGQFIGSPILGSLSDDYGRKRLLAGSLLISALCNLFTGLAIEWHHLGLLIASRFMGGLMEGNTAIARAMAADMTTISKHETFGKINAVTSIAYVLGPLLGGILTDKEIFHDLSTSVPFYFICFLFVALSGLSAKVLESDGAHLESAKRSIVQRINLIKRLSRLFSNKQLQFLMITSTCSTLAVDIFYEFCPVYLTIKWELAPSQLALYNCALCLCIAIGSVWLPAYCTSHARNKKAIMFCLAGFAFLLIGMVLTNSPPLMILLFSLSGFVIGLASTLISVKLSNTAGDDIQGEVMGVQTSLRVLGDAIICLLGGGLLLISSKLVIALAATMSFIAMLYYISKNHLIDNENTR